MNARGQSGHGSLHVAELMQLDEICDRYETALASGENPELAAFLDGVEGPSRRVFVRELLALDLEYRWRRGERPEAEVYRTALPGYDDVIDDAFAHIESSAKTLASRIAGRGSSHDRSSMSHTLASLRPAELNPAALEDLRAAGYEISGELGRGGMGVVYLARKVALNRRCAIKMILSGGHAGPTASARFRTEAETIARLRHPDIVQIYHVGEVGGLPYVELEYLPGGSLDKVLDGTPWPPMVAAELLETLARSIAHAHRQGVVHRDLKPANILLDVGRRPKVADFGLAKLLDSDDGLTRTQTVLGSPSYMAPEQADGRSRLVGATTDVYAMGAIFYELLTGRPPFRAATTLETLAQVRDSDPVPPSRLQPGLPRAVETICLKCLEKVPARRYATADELAEDLRRFRAGESILAQPAPAWEQARRWLSRKPAMAGALGVATVTLALLLGGGLYYNARLRESATKAQVAERAAIDQRNLALGALHQLVFEVQERLGDSATTRGARGSLLATAIQGLDAIARGTEGSTPDLSRAVAHLKLGRIYRQIGRATEARRQFELARTLAESLGAADPGDLAVTECLRDALAGLGGMRIDAGRSDEAQADFQKVVALAEQVAQAQPRRSGALRGRIEAYLQLGRAVAFLGRRREAEVWFQRMYDLARLWTTEEPGNVPARSLLATSYRKLADERKLVEDYAGARRYYLLAIATGREVLAAEPADHTHKFPLAVAIDDLAGVAVLEGQVAEARRLFDEAERLFAEHVEADPEAMDGQLRLVRTQSRSAALEREELKFARAGELYQRALDRLLRLDREGRLDGRPTIKQRTIRMLQEDVAVCAAAPEIIENPGALRSRSPGQACRLLLVRVRALVKKGQFAEALDAARALCDVEVVDPLDFHSKAHSLCKCVALLDSGGWPESTSSDRRAVSVRCADRAVTVLRQTIDQGFGEVSFIDDIALGPIRDHPGFREVANRLRKSSTPPTQ